MGNIRWRIRTRSHCKNFLWEVPFFTKGPRRIPRRQDHRRFQRLIVTADREISTQMAFGKILDDLSARVTVTWPPGS